MLILYDDTSPAPQTIRQIIGVDRFADLLRQRQRQADIIERIAQTDKNRRFVRISDEAARGSGLDMLERSAPDEKVFRLPSSLAPCKLDVLARTLEKLPYALDSTIFGGQFDDEAVALLSREDAISLLRITDPGERRSFFSRFSAQSMHIGNDMGLVDLRSVDSFLAYMTGATETRHFNQVEDTGGVFRKKSTDIAKMHAEYRYFHIVPEAMKRFLLPTFDYVESGSQASYAMEKLSIPDAAIQMVHFAFNEASFGTLLTSFFSFVAARAQRKCGVAAARETARTEILGKMHTRLDTLMGTSQGRRVDALMRVNDLGGGLEAMRQRASGLIEQAIATDTTDTLAVGHGDPCLSNILFHRDIGLFRLIDPRGATTLDAAFMHPLYDLAKFSHSVLGGYDFINNGLFECQVDSTLGLSLSLEGGGPPSWAKAAFIRHMNAAGISPRVVRAYELSLFLSMLPLHIDNPRKLPAFCLTAAAIMNELECTA
ncbi:MAG: hypothetical protein P4L92_12920 [Rudaea sp.]|nr:hypothetical protein [Rudaea sp.]